MAPDDHINITYQQAQNLQRDMERASTPSQSPVFQKPVSPMVLLGLERAGLLREDSGDEVRTIVAEEIADHFGERYRAFPVGVKHEGLNIHRDSIPKPCVLRTRIDRRVSVTSPASQASQVSYSRSSSLYNDGCRSMPKSTAAPIAKKQVEMWAAGISNTWSLSPPSEQDVEKKQSEGMRHTDNARCEAVFANPPKLSTSDPVAQSGSFVSTGQRHFQAAAPKFDPPTRKDNAPTKVVIDQNLLSAVSEKKLGFRNKGIIDVYETHELARTENHPTQLMMNTPIQHLARPKIESYAGDLIDLST